MRYIYGIHQSDAQLPVEKQWEYTFSPSYSLSVYISYKIIFILTHHVPFSILNSLDLTFAACTVLHTFGKKLSLYHGLIID